jgi:hypothetical protein
MKPAKSDVVRWVEGQRLAAERTAKEARREPLDLTQALDRIDDLKRAANSLGARKNGTRAERDNLAFHLTWARVRRAFGFG